MGMGVTKEHGILEFGAIQGFGHHWGLDRTAVDRSCSQETGGAAALPMCAVCEGGRLSGSACADQPRPQLCGVHMY